MKTTLVGKKTKRTTTVSISQQSFKKKDCIQLGWAQCVGQKRNNKPSKLENHRSQPSSCRWHRMMMNIIFVYANVINSVQTTISGQNQINLQNIKHNGFV